MKTGNLQVKKTKLQLRTLLNQHKILEQRIINKLSELPNTGGECGCDGESFSYIHEGNLFPEIVTVCVDCGGMKV